MLPGAIGEAIVVVDKSGQVIKTSKTILSVFKEAKEAYRSRKAEITAHRHAEAEEKRLRKALARTRITEVNDDAYSVDSRGSRRSRSHRHHHTRGIEDAADRDHRPRRESSHRHHHHSRDIDYAPDRRGDLVRRHTAAVQSGAPPTYYETERPHAPNRSRTVGNDIDLALAYGDIPEPLPPATGEEAELTGLLTKVNFVLDEAHCLQHSVTHTIAMLQKNPDALAAVALTLAEISNIVVKMAPGALAGLKGGFPAIFALLASPQFLIAAGVGVGITVVCLGGWKIVKRIQAGQAMAADPLSQPRGHLEEVVGVDVNRIDSWRRGIADVEAGSVGTSVDGEYITPEARGLRRQLLVEEGGRERDLVSVRDSISQAGRRGRRRSSGEGESEYSGRGRRSGKEKVKAGKKEKKGPGKLMLMFRHGDSVVV